MPFFNRAKKSDQVANPPLDGSNAPVPQAAANPDDDGAGEKNENAMALARTRTEDIVYPSGLKLAVLMTSVFVSMFLVALVGHLNILASRRKQEARSCVLYLVYSAYMVGLANQRCYRIDSSSRRPYHRLLMIFTRRLT